MLARFSPTSGAIPHSWRSLPCRYCSRHGRRLHANKRGLHCVLGCLWHDPAEVSKKAAILLLSRPEITDVNCAISTDKFYLLTSAYQMTATFHTIGTDLTKLSAR